MDGGVVPNLDTNIDIMQVFHPVLMNVSVDVELTVPYAIQPKWNVAQSEIVLLVTAPQVHLVEPPE